VIDLDLSAVLRKHWQSGAAASIVVREVPRDRVPNYGVVVCDSSGRIQSFQEKPSVDEARSQLVNTGIYIFEPSIIDLIPKDQDFDIGSELFPLILKKGLAFNAIESPFNWIDIGQLSDYWEANQQMMRGRLRGVEMPGIEVRPKIWTGLNVKIDWDEVRVEGPVYIGSASCIEPGVQIYGPTWIGTGCYLESGARISRSIVFDYSRVGPTGSVSDALVFGRNCVDQNGESIPDLGGALDWVADSRELMPPAK